MTVYLRRALAIIVVALILPALHSTAHADEHVMVAPGDLKWTDGPSSLPPGAKSAVIEGDPSKEGPFTLRLKMPPNYKIMPHTHPAVEHVTVLEGSLYMGKGEKFDEAAGKKLETSAFAVMPKDFKHFAFTKGKPATIQLHGMGPWGITYVDPAHDPRKK